MPDFPLTQHHSDAASLLNNFDTPLINGQLPLAAYRNSSIPHLGATPPAVNHEEASRVSISLNNERSRIQALLQLGDSISEGLEEIPTSTLSEKSSLPQALCTQRGKLDPNPDSVGQTSLKSLPTRQYKLPGCDQYFELLDALASAETKKPHELMVISLTTPRFSNLSLQTRDLLLHYAISQNLDNAVARSICYFGADYNATYNGLTPLMLSAHYKNANATKILLKPNLLCWTNQYAFPYSMGTKNLDSAYEVNDKFYTLKIDVNARDSSDVSALMMWLENGNTEIAELLISRGADVAKDLQVAAHGKFTKVLSGLVELLQRKDPDGLLSLNKWMDNRDLTTAMALYPYVGITEADLDAAAGGFRLPTLQLFMSLLKERSILAIDYIRAKHPLVANYLKAESSSSDWHILDVVTSSIDHALHKAGAASVGTRPQRDQLTSEVIQSIEHFEKSKDFEHLGAMRKSLVSFAQHQANPQPSVAIQQAWEKI